MDDFQKDKTAEKLETSTLECKYFFKTIISCIYYYKNFSLSFSRIMMIPTFLSNVDLNHKSLSHKKIYIFIGWMFLVLFDPSLTS